MVDFLEILSALSRSNARFIIVGGVAARLYGTTRLTHDLDIVPQIRKDTWGALIETIVSLGAKPRVPETLDRIKDPKNVEVWIEDKGMLALTFRTPDGLVEIDLLVGESHAFEDFESRARSVEVDGTTYRVASLEDLIAMKLKAGRPQDLLDVEELKKLT